MPFPTDVAWGAATSSYRASYRDLIGRNGVR